MEDEMGDDDSEAVGDVEITEVGVDIEMVEVEVRVN